MEKIDSSKRKLLFWGLALWTLALAGWITEVKAETSKNTKEILELSSIEKSEKFVWKNEVNNFTKIFAVSWENDFSKRISKIQTENWLETTGFLDKKTINFIYKNFYSKMNLETLPVEVKTKISLEKDFENYRKYSNLPLNWLKSPFSEEYFYWKNIWENVSGTFLNEKLLQEINDISIFSDDYNNWNSIQIDKIKGKYVLKMYLNWNLVVLTYVSPGTASNRTPQNFNSRIDSLNKYYVSWSYPKRSSWVNGWAVMPFAYEIDASRWIYWHIGVVNWHWLSHGCVRAPWFYQYGIYDLLQKSGEKNFKVKIWKLY